MMASYLLPILFLPRTVFDFVKGGRLVVLGLQGESRIECKVSILAPSDLFYVSLHWVAS